MTKTYITKIMKSNRYKTGEYTYEFKLYPYYKFISGKQGIEFIQLASNKKEVLYTEPFPNRKQFIKIVYEKLKGAEL